MQQQFSLWKTACLLNVIQNPIVLVFVRLLLDNLVQLINAKIHLRIKVQTLDVEVVNAYFIIIVSARCKDLPAKKPSISSDERNEPRKNTHCRSRMLFTISLKRKCLLAGLHSDLWHCAFTKTMLHSIKSHATSSGHHWLIFGYREFIMITIIQYNSLRKAKIDHKHYKNFNSH